MINPHQKTLINFMIDLNNQTSKQFVLNLNPQIHNNTFNLNSFHESSQPCYKKTYECSFQQKDNRSDEINTKILENSLSLTNKQKIKVEQIVINGQIQLNGFKGLIQFIDYALNKEQQNTSQENLQNNFIQQTSIKYFIKQTSKQKMSLQFYRKLYQKQKKSFESITKIITQYQNYIFEINTKTFSCINSHDRKRILWTQNEQRKKKLQRQLEEIKFKSQRDLGTTLEMINRLHDRQRKSLNCIKDWEEKLKVVINLKQNLLKYKQLKQRNLQNYFQLGQIYKKLVNEKKSQRQEIDFQSQRKSENRSLSNKQILEFFMKNLQKKVDQIRIAIDSHNQYTKFLGSLNLQENYIANQIRLTASSNNLLQDQFVDQMMEQYSQYYEYLSTHKEVKHIQEKLKEIEKVHYENLLFERKQSGDAKKMNEKCDAQIQELEKRQINQQSQIQQLQKILELKNMQLSNSRKSQIFSEGFFGISKLFSQII